jgi:hypothetical protein
MKTMSKKEFYEELERERKGAIRVTVIGIVACIIAVVAVVLLLLANEKEPKKIEYVETLMIA